MTETRDRLADTLADRDRLSRPGPAPRTAGGAQGAARSARPAGQRALELLPPAEDAASGPFIRTYLAQICTLTGDLDQGQAVATLRPLLALPSWITPAELVSDPLWAPIRAQPGFAALTSATP